MSWQAVESVFKHSQSKGNARLVLLAIAHHADSDGANAYPSVPTLAGFAHIQPRQVSRFLRELESSGELSTEVGGGRKSNRYTVLLPILSHVSTDTPASSTPAPTSRGAVSPQAGETSSKAVVGNVGLNIKNNNIGRAQLLRDLEALGVASGVAIDLVTKHPERVIEQLDFLPERNANDPAATLVAAVKGNWKAPAAAVKRRQAEESAAAKREAARRAEEAQAEAKRREEAAAAQAEAEGTALDARFEELSEAEQSRVDRLASERIALLPPPMRTGFALKMTRREILKSGVTRSSLGFSE